MQIRTIQVKKRKKRTNKRINEIQDNKRKLIWFARYDYIPI